MVPLQSGSDAVKQLRFILILPLCRVLINCFKYVLAAAPKPDPTPTCKAIIDLGFVLDSSGSLANDYHKEKDFLKALAGSFGISADGSRAGVVTFSSRAEHSIKMNEHVNINSFNTAVDNIALMGFQTRIDIALRLTQKELFAIQNGGRPNVQKILILLTDGSQTPTPGAEDPGDIADEIRNAGITVLVVGIGANTNPAELKDMAGGNDDKVFSAKSFDELVSADFISNIAGSTCVVGRCLFNQ